MSLGIGYHYSNADRALVITHVDPRGPAFEAAIQPGDKILRVDGLESDSGDVLSILKKQAGETMELVIQPKPRSSNFDRVLGSPLMGGILYAQPPRTVTLTLRDLPEQNIIDHIAAFFTPAPNPPPPELPGSASTRCGIGIGIQVSGPETTITELAPSGPAANSGQISRGDKIISVDGLEIAGLQVDVIKNLLLGEPDTYVSLTLKQPGRPDTFVVTLQRSFVVTSRITAPVYHDPFERDAEAAEPPPPRLKPGWLGKEFKLW